MKYTSGFDRDMRNGGWKLLENINDPVDFDISRLELVSFLQPGETDTRGETMVKRARGKEPVNGQKLVGCNWGQRHGETLLRNQRLIPMECRGKVIVLTGTIWRDDSHKRNIPCLIFDGEQWVLLFYWLDGSFSSFFQLFRLREFSSAP